MAEYTRMRNNVMGYPIYGLPYCVVFPLLDEDGDPVTGLTCDSEVSKNGDTAVDCHNEGVEIAFATATNKGMYYLDLTGAHTGTEMAADVVAVTVYTGATTSQATPMVLYPRKLPKILTGTCGATGNDTTHIHIPDGVAINDFYNGCVLYMNEAGNDEARMITDYVASTKLATLNLALDAAPTASTSTYEVYMTEVAIASIIALLTGLIPNAVAGAANGLFIAGTNAALTVTGETTLTGNVSLGGTLGVTGATTLASASVTGQLDAGNVLVDGTTVLTGNTTLSGDLQLTGHATLKEEVVLEKSLLVTGATTHTGVTTYTGAVTLTGGINAGAVSGTLANDLITAASLKADAVTEIQNGLATPTNITAGTIARVTLVDTCTTNTDMRGTNSAALASVCTETRLAELDAANLPTATDEANAHAHTIDGLISSATKGLVKVYDDMATAAELLKVPKSDSNVSLNATVLAAIADAIHDEAVESTITLRQLSKLILSILANKSTGGGTATLNFRDVADAKNRVVATVDADGNRTAVTLDVT
jgi:cytoskeletal protein CcmA (bactofilin family)